MPVGQTEEDKELEEQKKGIADVQEEMPAETMEDYTKELEASFRTINEGDVISGTVIDVNETGDIMRRVWSGQRI